MSKSEDEFARLRQRLLAWDARGAGAVMVLEAVDSTSDWLRRNAADSGADGWQLCVARQQTAGRGRGGNAWQSDRDAGLWFSLRLPVHTEAQSAAERMPPSVVLAAAIVDCLIGFGIHCGLKWPNDLWLGDAKVGGLLIEQFGSRGRRYWIVGVGINWRAPERVPPSVRSPSYGVSGLEESGVAMARSAVAEAIIARVVETMQQPWAWEDWMSLADCHHVLTGRHVELVRDGDVLAQGRVLAIECDGQLRLAADAGGEVRVGGAASVRFLD